MKAIVSIPTYNEAENIEALIHRILKLPVDIGVVVVDDNSPDGTGSIVDKLHYRFPDKVYHLHRDSRAGFAAAHRAGLKYALKNTDAEYILTMDADFSHNPKYIPKMLSKMEEYDIVIGSRYVEGGGTKNWGIGRKLMSRGANMYAKIILGLSTRDCTGGFRCFKRKVVEHIDVEHLYSHGYGYLIETLFKCQRRGYKVGEIPIIFVDRQFGKSKLSKAIAIESFFLVLKLGLRGEK